MTVPFALGGGPLVSIIFPSRGNPKGLSLAIQSLYHFAQDASLIEVLVKADDDDTETVATLQELSQRFPLRGLLSPRGRGYLDIPAYLEGLAVHARGDWLMVFSDDVVMATPQWDQILLNLHNNIWHGLDDIAFLQIGTVGVNFPELFILRRRCRDIMGGFGEHESVDGYLYHVMSFLMSMRVVPIQVLHGKRANPGLIPERQGGKDFQSIKHLRQRLDTTIRLLDHIEAELRKRGDNYHLTGSPVDRK